MRIEDEMERRRIEEEEASKPKRIEIIHKTLKPKCVAN